MFKITRIFALSLCYLSISLLTTNTVLASAEKPEAGFDYRIITNNNAANNTVSAPKKQQKIEVVEFFNYACGHCYAFEPHLKAWLEKNKQFVTFKRNPVGFNPTFEKLQKLYYVFEAMGMLEKMDDKIFTEIHKDGNMFSNDADIAKFAQKYNLNAKQIIELYNSFSVATKVQQANKLTDSAQINGVPNVMIAGKYVTSSEMLGSREKVLKIMDYLVNLEKPPAQKKHK
jgi:protein dithiol oxidoreductase (disulfide-forming)